MIDAAETSPPEIGEARRAIARAQDVLLRTQRAWGAWSSRDDMGPATLGLVAVTLGFAGQLDPADADQIGRALTAHQRDDGSFVAYPFAETGEVSATATCWAALRAVGAADGDPRVQRARAYVEAHGGVAAVVDQMRQGDFGALALAMAGILPAGELPIWLDFTSVAAIPLVERWMEHRVNVGAVMMLLQIGVVVSHLRGGSGGLLASAERRRCLELLETFRNRDGGWNGNALQTALALAALHASGLPGDDKMVSGAAAWLRRRLARGAATMTFDAFGSSVWSGALILRALIHSGVPRSHPSVARAVEWLLSVEQKTPQPAIDNAGPVRTGGWSFQHHNETLPDPDDTGVVLGALGLALEGNASGELPADLAGRVREAARTGTAWALGMQNADGGFPAFEHGLPGKDRAAPMMAHPILEHPSLWGALRLLVRTPPKLGDPSTADVTARLLYGLAHTGHPRGSPEVERMIAFLEAQQLPSGAYWGRWMVNYLPATAYVLMGLVAAGIDRGAPVVQRALRWILDHQNADGGFGEGVGSYTDPALAGIGPSTPPLTGLMLSALVDAGEGGGPAAARAARYLVAEQRPDGTWPNGSFLHVFVAPNGRPNSFYYLPLAAQFYPLEGLGRWVEASAGGSFSAVAPAPDASAPRGPDGAWNVAYLQRMRGAGDAVADAVVRSIFARGEIHEVHRLLARVVRSDDPIPEGLPEEVSDYFERTAVLPPWADPARIATAERLFVRHGWATAAALFCSSLPQAYAAAKGAAVLMASQRITDRIQRRIVKTAQFVFDVMDEGALAPGGRGIRSIQKVRLIHAAIRHFLLARTDPAWDPALGVPVNQEDLAGTLMTFSDVVLDAFRRLGLSYTAEEGEAFLHAWKVVGHVLGLDDTLLPRDVRDGEALMDAIRNDQWEASDAGRELTRVLVETMQLYLPVPGLRGLPAALIRHLAGDRCGDLLGLPRADWTRALVDAEAFGARETAGNDHGSRISLLVDHAAHALMKGVVDVQLLGEEPRFHIPSGLQSALERGTTH